MDDLRSLLGPLCAILGRFGSLCWRSGGDLGTYVGDLELLLRLYGRSWAALGASIGGLGCTGAALGACEVLEHAKNVTRGPHYILVTILF